MTLATDLIMSLAAVALLIAALIGVTRIAAGPSQLDRSVAADLIVAVVVASLGLWTAWRGLSTELLVVALLSMLGFTSAVSIARMVGEGNSMRRGRQSGGDHG